VWYVPYYDDGMNRHEKRLIDLLDAADTETVGTSIRLPSALRDAATVACEMGFTTSTTELTVQGLRDALDAIAQRLILDDHYRSYPEARPELAEIALAGAELDGSPLAQRPDLINRAATEILQIVERPTPDDVLIYAAALLSCAA